MKTNNAQSKYAVLCMYYNNPKMGITVSGVKNKRKRVNGKFAYNEKVIAKKKLYGKIAAEVILNKARIVPAYVTNDYCVVMATKKTVSSVSETLKSIGRVSIPPLLRKSVKPTENAPRHKFRSRITLEDVRRARGETIKPPHLKKLKPQIHNQTLEVKEAA